MSASPHDQPAHGTPAALREFLCECLQMAAFHATIGTQYAEAGDRPGLLYATRCAAAAMRQAVSVAEMLEERK